MESLLALGRENPEDASEPLNMAYIELHGSGQANGVASCMVRSTGRYFSRRFPDGRGTLRASVRICQSSQSVSRRT